MEKLLYKATGSFRRGKGRSLWSLQGIYSARGTKLPLGVLEVYEEKIIFSYLGFKTELKRNDIDFIELVQPFGDAVQIGYFKNNTSQFIYFRPQTLFRFLFSAKIPDPLTSLVDALRGHYFIKNNEAEMVSV